ncbi:hypothetical protein MPH_13363 [Macrophomina phaseolina MS6]|uniref:Uncharacterized protein n=1 Tax=Macrophomina phaseolina (strain MS6) TaxID=1126212 RepID=K2QIH3_MACPH|nr:hypothetical protein MPH_13363 [Macrophomina phaseolina MS6]
MAHEREHHLHQLELSEDAKKELVRITARLPPPSKWEDGADGKVEVVKKEDVSQFQDDIVEIKKSCKVCNPIFSLPWHPLTEDKIKGKYAYGIFRFKQRDMIPYNPSDQLQIIVPLEIEDGSRPKVKDKDLIYGWATYTTQAEEITPGVTILRFRAPEGLES